ncbi:Gfo/Idh/MocA family protein [Paenibacillus eucommiae]|uniref:Dehydrogenase n=1 Tax=Paenibacillus eucommiae TaxID=1355755 RepID=A0ABS4J3A4_9BACL|nr:Gfo/Idh/MocA family oxidoreductase [Paenibacillus eucommiae]MBP1994288.1 putative dehydrogenase [Paenibacillus eucommiae]
MKTYAICGVSYRALKMFIDPIVNGYKHHCRIVALLDVDPVRFEVCKTAYPALEEVPVYLPENFKAMIQQTDPDVVIVAGIDSSHVGYIVQALDWDRDVITEKPMVTTSGDCRLVLDAESRSKGRITVALNYRYTPIHTKIKEMLLDNRIGRITSVDLNWYLDSYHGASYFKRWNRTRAQSGGLSIHKSTHHFDLVSWWVGAEPVEAFAYGALNYYGSEGELNPKKGVEGRHCGTCNVKENCTYMMRWTSRSREIAVKDDHLVEGNTNGSGRFFTDYRPDACIFDSEIDIEDTFAAVVKYEGNVFLNYSVNFSLPYEGYRLAINGTKGRIETQMYHSSRITFPVPAQTIDYFPLFGSKESISVVPAPGMHSGADPMMQEHLFLGPDPTGPHDRLPSALDGAYSVATGEAVWRSAREGLPMRIAELLSGTD